MELQDLILELEKEDPLKLLNICTLGISYSCLGNNSGVCNAEECQHQSKLRSR